MFLPAVYVRALFMFWLGLSTASCMAPAAPTGASSESLGGAAPTASRELQDETQNSGSSPSAAASVPQKSLDAAVVPSVCTAGPHDVNITIVSVRGPQGGAPRAINNTLYSMNVDDQRAYDYVPTLNPNYVAFLAALRPALLRWPSGYYSQTYQFTTTGTGAGALTPDLIDGFMNLCHTVGAKPLMGVNIETGTAQNAAQLVQFVNGSRNYGVAWWQIGNEPDVDGQDSVHNPNAYAANFKAFRQAMQAADGNIKFVGAELFTGADIMAGYGSDHTDWLTPMLMQTQNTPMDAIAWHYYPLDSSQTSTTSSAVPSAAHALQETAHDWPPAGLDFAATIFQRLKTLQASYAPKAQLWVTEYAEDSGVANGAGISDTLVGALWAADVLGRFAEQGADALFRYTFKGGAEHKYSLIDELDHPRPEYYSYWLYAQHFGDAVVDASSDSIAQVAVHASMRSKDNSLRVVFVNKTRAVRRTRVALGDYVPTRARSFQLMGPSAESTDVTLNGEILSMANIGAGEHAIEGQPAPDACTATVLTLPPLSVTLLVYENT